MIDALLQEGTDRALDDQVARPRPTPPPEPRLFGLDVFAAPFQGIGGGAAKSMAFGAEVLGAFGQVAGAYDPASSGGMFSTQNERERGQAETARQRILKGGPDYSNSVGDAFRYRAADILPDPKTASASAQIVGGLADFATRAVGYSITLGPLGPVAMGADTALEEADRLKQQGVDLGTRAQAGAVAGVMNAAGVAIPMSGPTALYRFGVGVASGEATMVGQTLAEREILRAAGYDKLADTFDPLDPVMLAMGIVPGALGARFGKPKPLPALKTEADVRRAAQLTPEEAAREAAYERSPANLRALEQAIAAEKRPEIRAELEAELRKQTAAAAGEHAVERAVQADADLAPAARVGQVAEALEASRLTPDADLAGRDAHLSAVELAADQIGRGERVEVAPRVQVAEAAPVEFTTARGSVYQIHEDGTTSRNKAARSDPGHEGDFGQKDRTARTVYVDSDAAALTAAGLSNLGERGARVVLQDGRATLVTWNEQQGRWGAAASARDIPVHDTPAVGRYPLELWKPADDVPGHQAFSKMHAGNQITSMRTRVDRTAAASDQLRAARPQAQTAERATSRTVRAPEAARPEPTSPEATAKAPPGPQETRSGAASTEAPSSVARAADEAAKLDPDMLVQLEGMDAPMRVGDLLAKVQEEARQDTLMGKLVEVAAACDLTA